MEDLNLDAALPLSRPKNSVRAKPSPVKQSKEARNEEFEAIYAEMASDDWKRRSQGIDNIGKVIMSAPEEFADRHVVQRLFDVFLERCRDGNSKVTQLALETLGKILPVLTVSFWRDDRLSQRRH